MLELELEGVLVVVVFNKWDFFCYMLRERMYKVLGFVEFRKSRFCESFFIFFVFDSKFDFFDMLEWLNDNIRWMEENRWSNIVIG